MSTLKFLLPDHDSIEVPVTALFNAGFAGRDPAATRAHIAELAELGVPEPPTVPTVYSLPPRLATQETEIAVRTPSTSGEVEAAIVITGPGPEDVLLTVASDHTDRGLETHDIAEGKAAAPDVLATRAWRLTDVAHRPESLVLTASVGHGTASIPIQRGSLADVLPVDYWLALLETQTLRRPGTVLLLGTVPMLPGVDQFQSCWHIAIEDRAADRGIACRYRVRLAPELLIPRRPTVTTPG